MLNAKVYWCHLQVRMYEADVSVICSCKAVGCSKKMRCQHRTSWKCYCVCVGVQNKMHMFREYFLSFTARKITEKLNLPNGLLAKLQPFLLKLVCFKDLE